ncbi:MAG: hypothetical protein AAF478_11240 [Pseudomonadota bacterium]
MVRRSVQAGCLFCDAGLEFLFLNYFEAQLGFEAVENQVTVNAGIDRSIAIGANGVVKTIVDGLAPKFVIGYVFEPFYDLISVFEYLHRLILSWVSCATQRISSFQSTGHVPIGSSGDAQ